MTPLREISADCFRIGTDKRDFIDVSIPGARVIDGSIPGSYEIKRPACVCDIEVGVITVNIFTTI